MPVLNQISISISSRNATQKTNTSVSGDQTMAFLVAYRVLESLTFNNRRVSASSCVENRLLHRAANQMLLQGSVGLLIAFASQSV